MQNTLSTVVKQGENDTVQSSLSYDKSFTLGLSFLLGIVSFAMIMWQRMSGAATINADIPSLNSVASPYPDIQHSSHGIQFPGLTPLVVSSVIAYQSGNPVMGLLGSWPFWSGTAVQAQGLPAIIDFNNAIPTNLGFMLRGAVDGDLAGYSVANAGDVNGDGQSDFLVGALYASPGGRNQAGIVYLIYGAANLTATIDLGRLTAGQGVVIQGGAAFDRAGGSLASAGDVNGDGKGDFLIGSDGADPGGRTTAGTAYLIYGGANLPAIIDLGNLTAGLGVVLQGGAASDRAGYSVASAGDVNGDGKSDFLVGGYTASPGGRSEAGIVYLIYGAANLPAIINLGSLAAVGVVLEGGASGDKAGASVASVGDVDDDGKSDFLIGAYRASPGGRSQAGVVYLMYGSASLPASINLRSLTAGLGVLLQGAVANDYVGVAVSSAGDVNGDGKPDMLIGANGVDPGGRASAGAVYIIYGAASLPAIINLGNLTADLGVTLQGGAASDDAGFSVSSAGDMNGDGKSDILIGADYADPNGRNQAGAAYLVYGAANLPTTINLGSLTTGAGVAFQGALAGDFAGYSVAGIGDVNGDGGLDILIGAYKASSTGRSQGGAAYVIYGPPLSKSTSIVTPVISSLSTTTLSKTSIATTQTTSSSKMMSATTQVGLTSFSTRPDITQSTTSTDTSFRTPSTTTLLSGMTPSASESSLSGMTISSNNTSQASAQNGNGSSRTPNSASTTTTTQLTNTSSSLMTNDSSMSLTTSTLQPGPTIMPEDTTTMPNSSTAIVGGVAGGVVVLGVCLAACGVWRKKRNHDSVSADLESSIDNSNTNSQSSTATNNYAKIDNLKQKAQEYDHISLAMVDDLKIKH